MTTVKIKGAEVSEEVLNIITTGMCITLHSSILIDRIEEIEKHHTIYRAKIKQSLKTTKDLLLKAVIELASDYELIDKYNNAEELVREDLNNIFDKMKKNFYETCIVPEEDREKFLEVVNKKEADFQEYIKLYKSATDKGQAQCLINLKKNQK